MYIDFYTEQKGFQAECLTSVKKFKYPKTPLRNPFYKCVDAFQIANKQIRKRQTYNLKVFFGSFLLGKSYRFYVEPCIEVLPFRKFSIRTSL